jgi:cyclopropane fatty-acyl-phospholipid synthase-like methyltransferase
MNDIVTHPSNHYWTNFWQRQANDSQSLPDQHRVLRTLSKRPIKPPQWHSTVDYVLSQLNLSPEHDVLDLAGGNGLLAKEIQPHVNSVTVVDVAQSLLPASCSNFKSICADMRHVDFAECSFDRILLYAAIQYLTLAETTQLLENASLWLKPGGVLFIGDIPDANRRWNFFDTPARRRSYFESLVAGKPIVGTWFDRRWLERLGSHVGLKHVTAIDQPADQIYAWFRFDFRGEK